MKEKDPACSNLSRVVVIIPALNEEASIGEVVRGIAGNGIDEVIVVDNGSTDHTARKAREAGATVLREDQRGYGAACLKGIAYINDSRNRSPDDVVLFMDGDLADDPSYSSHITGPVLQGKADFVLGSRTLGKAEKGALTPVQRFGNHLATTLMKLFFRVSYTDLGPYRAIRLRTLNRLGMADRNYGWTIEMQIKAARQGVAFLEVPVPYRKRIGQSKVSGTVRGSINAGIKILYTIFKYL